MLLYKGIYLGHLAGTEKGLGVGLGQSLCEAFYGCQSCRFRQKGQLVQVVLHLLLGLAALYQADQYGGFRYGSGLMQISQNTCLCLLIEQNVPNETESPYFNQHTCG